MPIWLEGLPPKLAIVGVYCTSRRRYAERLEGRKEQSLLLVQQLVEYYRSYVVSTLKMLREQGTINVLGLRDIMDDPIALYE